MGFKVGLQGLCAEVGADRQTRDWASTALRTYTATVDVAAVTTLKQTLQNVTMTGILVDDILIGFDFRPATALDCGFSCRIVANDTVQLVTHHDAATTTDPGSATLTVYTLRI